MINKNIREVELKGAINFDPYYEYLFESIRSLRLASTTRSLSTHNLEAHKPNAAIKSATAISTTPTANNKILKILVYE